MFRDSAFSKISDTEDTLLLMHYGTSDTENYWCNMVQIRLTILELWAHST